MSKHNKFGTTIPYLQFQFYCFVNKTFLMLNSKVGSVSLDGLVLLYNNNMSKHLHAFPIRYSNVNCLIKRHFCVKRNSLVSMLRASCFCILVPRSSRGSNNDDEDSGSGNDTQCYKMVYDLYMYDISC